MAPVVETKQKQNKPKSGGKGSHNLLSAFFFSNENRALHSVPLGYKQTYGYFCSRLREKLRTGYHTAAHPTTNTVKKMSTKSQK